MDELLTAIGDNFEGHEKLRQTLINKAPKYGNDDDYADSIAKEISQHWSTEARTIRRRSPAVSTGRATSPGTTG